MGTMMENFRVFEVRDPSGKIWKVAFQWLQTAISIRHSDSVDVKFSLSCGDAGMEKVIALPHPALLALSAKGNRPLSDPWCVRLAALHLTHMIETETDMDKRLVTVAAEELAVYSRSLEASAPAA
jgi:hypothetical protein